MVDSVNAPLTQMTVQKW